VRYRVHRLDVEKDALEEPLERFLNRLEGSVVAIVPHVSPVFQGMGATAKTDYVLIVEGVE